MGKFDTERLTIRSFEMDDLLTIHRILDHAFGEGTLVDDADAIAERRSWLEWQLLNSRWLPALYQPPFGDRALVLKETGELVGSIGFVPCLDRYELIPQLRAGEHDRGCTTTGVGLFWAIDPAHQRKGYATEAGKAFVELGFRRMRLARILATTEADNHASIAVMRKLGMEITRNPSEEAPWLQVVGVLNNPEAASAS